MRKITLVALLLLALLELVVSHQFQNSLSTIHVENIQVELDDQIQIVADPSHLEYSGEWVTVRFSGIAEPNETDWIGVYSPSNVNVQQTAPVKFKLATYDKNYLKNGEGSVQFSVLNMWGDYSFKFMRNGTDYPIFAASSNVVSFKKWNMVTEGHLSLTNKPHEMRLGWASGDNEQHYVKWGTSKNHYQFTAKAKTEYYTPADLCGEPATTFGWRFPGYLHSAVMTNLIPGATYYYIFGSDGSAGWSQEFKFHAAPVVSPATGVSLFAYGDLGHGSVDGSDQHWDYEPGALNTTKGLLQSIDEMDLVVHIGDISYAVGFSAEWNEFMQQVEPISARLPYMTCIGNHERDFPDSDALFNGTDSGGECGVPYQMRFPMPNTAQDKTYYSFDYGNIHFVLMSTEHNFYKGSAQYKFLEQDLASVNRSLTPWIIFGGHRPMYIDSTNNDTPNGDLPVAKSLRDNIEPLLVKYKVNLALWGHHHSYQRTCHVYNEQCGSNDLPVHVVIGMAGCGLSQNIDDVAPDWIVSVNDQEYGFTKIFTTETSLHMQYFTNSNYDTPYDEFYIYL